MAPVAPGAVSPEAALPASPGLPPLKPYSAPSAHQQAAPETQQMIAERALSAVFPMVKQLPKDAVSPYVSAVPDREVRDSASSPVVPRAAAPIDEPDEPVLGVADRKQLLAIEIAARGKPFASLADKLDAEDRIDALQRAIAQPGVYPGHPTPSALGVDELSGAFKELSARCAALKDVPEDGA